MGGVAGSKVGANRAISYAAGVVAPALDVGAPRNQAGGVEAEFASSRDGLAEPRKDSRTVRVARTPPRRARYFVKGTDGLVGEWFSVLTCRFSITAVPARRPAHS